MAQVFISYASKSKPLVSLLAQDLETAGHNIWFDHKLTGGQSWWDQILERIRECDLFVFALTPDALNSIPCTLEYKYANALNKNILPVMVADGVSTSILPPELSAIQFVDYRGKDRQVGVRLMYALNQLPPVRPLPDPLPPPPDVPLSYLGGLNEQINAQRPLSFDEQAALVLKLKEAMSDPEHRDDAINLLRRMQRRDDLLARINKEIEVLLESAAPRGSFSNPFARGSSPPRAEERAEPAPEPKREPKARYDEGDTLAHRATFRSTLLPMLVVSVISGGVMGTAIIGKIFGWGFNYYYISDISATEWLLGLAAFAVHGILIALILRRLETPPPQRLTLDWFARSALMGGPLNALLLRRLPVPINALIALVVVTIAWIIGLVVPRIVRIELISTFSSSFAASLGALALYAILSRIRSSNFE